MLLLVCLSACVVLAAGDSCTQHNHPTFGQVGKCIRKSCCAYGTYISSLCAGDDMGCCFKADTCSGSTSTGGLDCPGGHRYSARGTAYYPADNPLEGGFVDMRGARLRTLQQFLAGSASYVSVAMDNHAGIAYGTTICIPEMNQRYNKHIVFKVVDTGSAFYGKGHSRIDICVSSQANSYDATINGHLTLVFP
ncbi:uncharacterized protein [Haliotis asinina]|uniref:uncharacterized protein n=1 Tax=Haliotis asinina TaxID=109174 RepID=UPI0035324476